MAWIARRVARSIRRFPVMAASVDGRIGTRASSAGSCRCVSPASEPNGAPSDPASGGGRLGRARSADPGGIRAPGADGAVPWRPARSMASGDESPVGSPGRRDRVVGPERSRGRPGGRPSRGVHQASFRHAGRPRGSCGYSMVRFDWETNWRDWEAERNATDRFSFAKKT